jgi:hypothetical protein
MEGQKMGIVSMIPRITRIIANAVRRPASSVDRKSTDKKADADREGRQNAAEAAPTTPPEPRS